MLPRVIWLCPVCGARNVDADPEFENETYVGKNGAEMKIVLPYCNGKDCGPIKAANVMDSIADHFFGVVGQA